MQLKLRQTEQVATIMSKFTNAVERGLSGYTHESVGKSEGCEQCLEFDEAFFSWQSCEVCGSSLGGDRYPAHACDAEGAIIHLDVCVDCLQYIANGEEPEIWEE